MQCCNKHVIIYSGARVSELIRAIRSFISIDVGCLLYFKTVTKMLILSCNIIHVLLFIQILVLNKKYQVFSIFIEDFIAMPGLMYG